MLEIHTIKTREINYLTIAAFKNRPIPRRILKKFGIEIHPAATAYIQELHKNFYGPYSIEAKALVAIHMPYGF